MLVRVPAGVDPLALASASDNLTDAYRTVAPHLLRSSEAPVLIVGGGAKSIGLYAVGIAKALGSSRTTSTQARPAWRLQRGWGRTRSP